MILSNDGLVAFHYRSYGTFFYIKIGSVIFIGGGPTTNIMESFYRSEYQKKGRNVSFLELSFSSTHYS